MTLTTTEELKHLASSDNANELTRRLARECLANREAQPVGFRYRHKDTVSWLHNDWRWPDSVEAEQCQIEWLYTAQPAPANAQPVLYASEETLAYAKEGEKSLVTWSEPMGDAVIPLFTAPPAPAVPDDVRHLKNVQELYHSQEKRLFTLAQRIKGASFDKYSHTTAQAIDVLEREIFGDDGDACRAAMLAQPVSSGYKLVPAEPTEDMIAAAMNCDDVSFNADETFCVNFGNIYAAMLAAAPEGGNDHDTRR
ncbi:hypothetical protein N7583_22555 [Serratia marcescens]|uniref:hypothetical protein n=1 Tax=Serratia marcescens TaxID=615 RepID=UPI002882C003|nr:hypothetical protein [Serratia marcescens]MDT0228547.1 hypothetical protein [Serratia marcescens]